jgi:hypothetical protein
LNIFILREPDLKWLFKEGYMKATNTTIKQFTLGTTLIAISVLMGCSSSSQNNNSALPVSTSTVPNAYIIDTTTSTSTSSLYSGGSTVAFTPASLSVMNEYTATHPLNNPTNFKINLNLSQVGAGRYGGDVSISYSDNGIQYNGVFKAGLGNNLERDPQTGYKYKYDNGRLEADYNFWFKYENKLVFTGFFEDQYGAITITLVPQTTTASGNDAEPTMTGPYKGYVYFKNFGLTGAGHAPGRSCWYTYLGSYDCRSNVIQTKCGLYPGAEAGYKLLGTFTGVDVNSAFNIQ